MNVHNTEHKSNHSINHMNVDSKKIIEFVKKERVVTSSDLAKHLKISWNTAEKYLMEVLIEGKLDRIKKEGTTLWMEKK